MSYDFGLSIHLLQLEPSGLCTFISPFACLVCLVPHILTSSRALRYPYRLPTPRSCLAGHRVFPSSVWIFSNILTVDLASKWSLPRLISLEKVRPFLFSLDGADMRFGSFSQCCECIPLTRVRTTLIAVVSVFRMLGPDTVQIEHAYLTISTTTRLTTL